jgi:hypothetical protein
MEFVLWFMGSKQDPNNNFYRRNQYKKNKSYTSGIANRLLIKKKALILKTLA